MFHDHVCHVTVFWSFWVGLALDKGNTRSLSPQTSFRNTLATLEAAGFGHRMANSNDGVHHVAREDNCPTADDTAAVARWAFGMLRNRPADEAAAPEYCLQLSMLIGRDVSLASLITSMLKVRRHYI